MRGSGTAPPLNSADEKSKPGCCRAAAGTGESVSEKEEHMGCHRLPCTPAAAAKTAAPSSPAASPHLCLEALQEEALLIGLPLILLVMDEVHFNEKGNQIRMVLRKK